MKLNSKYFDGIRVKPEDDRTLKKTAQTCDWKGCNKPGSHRAPKGRGRDGEYFYFCVDHVREYNKSYNYFSGMSDDQVSEYQESAMTGHRPTWTLGVNKTGKDADNAKLKENNFKSKIDANDVHSILEDDLEAEDVKKTEEKKTRRRAIRNLERKSLKKLNLDETASAEDIKTNFKELVKRHHPDLHGGDRDSEDRLREIIQAYNYLKQVGLC